MSRHGFVSPLVTIAVAIFTIMLAALVMFADNGAAGAFPKVVRGYVWDSAGRVVEGADVTINIKDGVTVLATYAETTNASGAYSLTVAPADWNLGNTIELIADFNGNQDTNSTVATNYPIQFLNMTFTFEIPEFGSMTGFLVAGGLLGAVAVVAFVYFKKR